MTLSEAIALLKGIGTIHPYDFSEQWVDKYPEAISTVLNAVVEGELK